jgi:hypothetical protein
LVLGDGKMSYEEEESAADTLVAPIEETPVDEQ